jgi:ssDNA-binding Zn-finger/Zn-ribbon topoisomerase 1
MSKQKLRWIDSKVYCYKCGKLTKLAPTKQGLRPCPYCGADLLSWYLQKVGLRQATKEAVSVETASKPNESEQVGISKGNEGFGGYV